MNQSRSCKFGRGSIVLNAQRLAEIAEWIRRDGEDQNGLGGFNLNQHHEDTLSTHRLSRRIAYIRHLASLSFVLTICTICIQQCSIQFGEYFKYNTRLQVGHSRPSGTLSILPGLTVCNNNRFNMFQLTKISPNLEQDLMALLAASKSDELMTDSLESAKLLKSFKDLIDQRINLTALLRSSSMNKLLELSHVKLIKDVHCNPAWAESFNCQNIPIYQSYQNSPCYTLFHLGAKTYAKHTKDLYNFDKALLNGTLKQDIFENNEVAEVFLNFNPFEHADFDRDVGGTLVVHPSTHAGSVKDHNVLLIPGYSYEVFIRRTTNYNQPPPYSTMCFDYLASNMQRFHESSNATPRVELDKMTCVRNCISKMITESLKCWPIEVPFLTDDTHRGGQLRMCPWAYEEMSRTSDLYTNHYKRNQLECARVCPASCEYDDIKFNVVRKRWPSDDEINNAGDKSILGKLLLRRKCCARLSIKYYEFMENKIEMIPNMTITELVSNIGGIVSAFVGVSIITIYRFFRQKLFKTRVKLKEGAQSASSM